MIRLVRISLLSQAGARSNDVEIVCLFTILLYYFYNNCYRFDILSIIIYIYIYIHICKERERERSSPFLLSAFAGRRGEWGMFWRGGWCPPAPPRFSLKYMIWGRFWDDSGMIL